MMNKYVLKVISGGSVLLLHLLILSMVLLFTVFRTDFLLGESVRYHVAEKLHLTGAEVEEAVSDMMDYVMKNGPLPQTKVWIHNEKTAFFNQRELEHLADIRGMIRIWYVVILVGIVVFAVFLVLLIKRKKLRVLWKSYLFSWLWLCGFAAFLLVSYKANPMGFIDNFHRLFFRNNRWVFNPVGDRIIHLFPEALFYDALIRILIVLAAAHTLLTAGLAVCVKKPWSKGEIGPK